MGMFLLGLIVGTVLVGAAGAYLGWKIWRFFDD